MSEPRTWAAPDRPAGVKRVQDRDGQLWMFDGGNDLWVLEDGPGPPYEWKHLLVRRGPLTEVVETEVEAAARRLRELGYTSRGTSVAMPDGVARDVRTVLAHVLNGGTL